MSWLNGEKESNERLEVCKWQKKVGIWFCLGVGKRKLNRLTRHPFKVVYVIGSNPICQTIYCQLVKLDNTGFCYAITHSFRAGLKLAAIHLVRWSIDYDTTLSRWKDEFDSRTNRHFLVYFLRILDFLWQYII